MSRILLASAVLCLSACSPKGAAPPPAKTPPPPVTVPPPPAPEMAPPPANPPPPPTAVRPKPGPETPPDPAPKFFGDPPDPVPPKAPSQSFAPTPGVHLPAFTFRTMDGKAVMVQINGENLSTTPSLWSITPSFKAETFKLGDAWPPDGAKFVGKTQNSELLVSWAEVYVIDNPERLAQIAPLRKGECLLAVKGVLDGVPIRGPLRLYVEGYRFIDYTPLVTPDGDDASRFARTLWFERISDQ